MNHWVNVGTGCVFNPYSENILKSSEWLCVKRHPSRCCGVSIGVLGTIADGCTDYKHVLQQTLHKTTHLLSLQESEEKARPT